MPTTSRSTPTTTNAVNENRRPPLTTLATRLISTTRSWRSRPVAETVRSRVAISWARLAAHLSTADRIRTPSPPRGRPRRAPSPARGTCNRRGRTPRSGCRRRQPVRPAAPRPGAPAPSAPDPAVRARSSSPPRACGRRRRRPAARRCPGSSERPRSAGARRCPGSWPSPDGVASASAPAWSSPSCALAHLPRHVLALVADPLALVGLGLALLADVGGDLPDLLLGGALDDDAGRLGHLELDSV